MFIRLLFATLKFLSLSFNILPFPISFLLLCISCYGRIELEIQVCAYLRVVAATMRWVGYKLNE